MCTQGLPLGRISRSTLTPAAHVDDPSCFFDERLSMRYFGRTSLLSDGGATGWWRIDLRPRVTLAVEHVFAQCCIQWNHSDPGCVRDSARPVFARPGLARSGFVRPTD